MKRNNKNNNINRKQGEFTFAVIKNCKRNAIFQQKKKFVQNLLAAFDDGI